MALEWAEEQGALPEQWAGQWERYVEGKVDPRSSTETLKAKIREAGEDMRRILVWARQQGARWENAEPIQLLDHIFEENYQCDQKGELQQTRAQPPGAVHTPHEPQAQWSSKSTTKDKDWVGYKTQVAENGPRPALSAGRTNRQFHYRLSHAKRDRQRQSWYS